MAVVDSISVSLNMFPTASLPFKGGVGGRDGRDDGETTSRWSWDPGFPTWLPHTFSCVTFSWRSGRNTFALQVEMLSSSTATINRKILLASLEAHAPTLALLWGWKSLPDTYKCFLSSLFCQQSEAAGTQARLYQNAVELEFKCFYPHTAAAVIRTSRLELEAC